MELFLHEIAVTLLRKIRIFRINLNKKIKTQCLAGDNISFTDYLVPIFPSSNPNQNTYCDNLNNFVLSRLDY